MESAGYVARCVHQVIFRRTAGVAVAVTGVASTFAGPDIAVVNHVTFVCLDYHRVIFRGEGTASASTLSSTHRATSPLMATGTGAMAASKTKSGKVF